MMVSQGLNARLIDLGFVVLGGVAVWLATQYLASKADKVLQPVGSLMSDITAGLNGWEAVELSPLLIQQSYLTSDYRLNDDAESVLWGVEQYQPYLVRLFGERGAPLKSKYYPLIGVPIEQ